jgi:SAM-dependent methyltransferase
MQEFWNKRYAENEMVFGYKPNQFFKVFIDLHISGTLLLPAEGEGRNAVYAAEKGWQVDAFDFSEMAKDKALTYAATKNVNINYYLQDIAEFIATKQYDAVALVYVHLPEPLRNKFHQEIYKAVKPGGFILLEAYTKNQLEYNSGGPKDIGMLYGKADICRDFPLLDFKTCEEMELVLDEGPFHQGKAAVLRLIGQKKTEF